VLQSGGTQNVSSGGIASDVHVKDGGHQVVWSSGTADATIVSLGGTLEVGDGGTASGAQVAGFEFVYSGGSDVGATVNDGGEQDVYGSAGGVTVESGG